MARMGLQTAQVESQNASPRWAHIKTSLFFTSQDVEKLLFTPEQRRTMLAYFAPLRLSRVYLEGSHRESLGVAQLREIAQDLATEGLHVSGAVVPAGR